MKCIAIDDEPMALEILRRFCQRHGHLELQTFTNPVAGIRQVKKEKPDILFLDVEMGTLNGVELAKELPPGVSLIFTTAYAQYAVDGFELNAVDFLCKPFSFSRFEKAVHKVAKQQTLQEMAAQPVFKADEIIALKVNYKNRSVKIGDIVYIEAMNNYIRIHLVDKKVVMAQMTMKGIQSLLPVDKFVRVHKSFIVPTYRISSYTSRQVILYDGTEIPIGRSYLSNL